MLLELANHDGDVERAIALLSGGDHPFYREIIRRLRDAPGRRPLPAGEGTPRQTPPG
jgi:hypothetical protein